MSAMSEDTRPVPVHDHAYCIKAMASFFRNTCACGHPLRNHVDPNEADEGPCQYCDCKTGSRGGVPVCGIQDEMPYVAEHCLPGIVTGGFRLYCGPCFIDIYGPHDCERLGCAPNCRDAGRPLGEA